MWGCDFGRRKKLDWEGLNKCFVREIARWLLPLTLVHALAMAFLAVLGLEGSVL